MGWGRHIYIASQNSSLMSCFLRVALGQRGAEGKVQGIINSHLSGVWHAATSPGTANPRRLPRQVLSEGACSAGKQKERFKEFPAFTAGECSTQQPLLPHLPQDRTRGRSVSQRSETSLDTTVTIPELLSVLALQPAAGTLVSCMGQYLLLERRPHTGSQTGDNFISVDSSNHNMFPRSPLVTGPRGAAMGSEWTLKSTLYSLWITPFWRSG